jgi:hypothetical protein
MMTPAIFVALEWEFDRFRMNPEKAISNEFSLPDELHQLLAVDASPVSVIDYDGNSFGLSYPSDKPFIVSFIRTLHRSERYLMPLWN